MFGKLARVANLIICIFALMDEEHIPELPDYVM